MFWALKGATLQPSWRKMRHSADTRTLFPTDEAVPCTISVLAGIPIAPEAGPSVRLR